METVAKVVKKLQDYIGAVSNCVAAGAVECPAKGRTWRVVGRPAASGSGRQWRKVEHKARPYVSRNPFFKTPEGGAGCLTAVVVHLATRSPRVLSRVWRRNAGSRFWLHSALLYAPTLSPQGLHFRFQLLNALLYARPSQRGSPFSLFASRGSVFAPRVAIFIFMLGGGLWGVRAGRGH